MHTAPPATCPLARRGFWPAACSLVCAAGMSGLALSLGAESAWAVGVATVLGGLLASAAWRRRVPGELAWTGACWTLAGRSLTGMTVVWDGGRWLLAHAVDAQGQGRRTRWLPLDAADARSPAQWHAVRVALQQGRQGAQA